jgi:glyoxylase-like metal-dependent hydrolase (beta-lactamase superfamily II)
MEVVLPKKSTLVENIFVPYGAYGENCYILACPNTRKAAAIDPGGSVDEILQRLSDQNSTLDMILITHAHGDHIGGIKELVSAIPNIQVITNPLESHSLPNIKEYVQVSLGNLDIIILHTPGHTPGSTCYYTDGVCFVGDTLFAGSIGKPASQQVYEKMLSSIRDKIFALPDDTILCTGHGPMTTVAEEKAHNPFF